jgi:hypothetical protein
MARYYVPASLAVFLAMTVASVTCGQEPEQLPPPKVKVPEAAPPSYYVPYPAYVVPSVPPPMNSREGWAYFAPNQFGQMRPRVILSPYGSYYLYNGRPFYGVWSGNGFFLRKTID